MCESEEREYEIVNKKALADYEKNIRKKIIAEVGCKNAQKLCHYTSAAALCSMLQEKTRRENDKNCNLVDNEPEELSFEHNGKVCTPSHVGEFWFSKWNCLNDPTEFRLIHGYIEEWINKHKKDCEGFCNTISTYNAWENYVKSDITEDWGLFRHEYDVFVASFTQDDDLLNMWNAYAAESDGYSITFDSCPFNESNDNYEIQYASVIYCESEHRRIVNDLMELLREAYESNEVKAEGNEDRDLIICTLFGEIVSQIGGCLKHHSYKEEKEIRAIIRLTPQGRALIRYRASSGAIIPYVPVEFDIGKISSIRISPTLSEGWAIPGLRSIRNYTNLDFDIKESEIPIRKV